jgi:hypothetical protein
MQNSSVVFSTLSMLLDAGGAADLAAGGRRREPRTVPDPV